MTFSPFGYNGIGSERLSLGESASHLHHNFVPCRVYLVCGGHQQSVCFTATQYPETLSLFHPV